MRWRPAFLVLPFVSGCLAFGYPTLWETPALSVPDEDVRAFRVESQYTRGGCLIAGWINCWHHVEEIPVVAARVGAQNDAYFSYYYLLFPFTGNTSRSMRVLLYRPGHETVEIPERPWWRFPGLARPEPVVWKEAPDLAAQEKALETVVVRQTLCWKHCHNKKLLEFAAQECARLADSPLAHTSEMAETRGRLLTKAKEYDALAKQQGP